MTRRNEPTGPNESTDTADGLAGYPREAGDATVLGVSARGTPIYHDVETNRRLEGYSGTEDPTDEWRDEVTHDEGVTVGDVIDDVEETSGWDELTDYARDHLPGAGDGDSGGDRT